LDPKKEDFIKEWIYEGNNDLGLAEFVIKNDGTYYDLVCFHCQQAAEKFLKAYIIYLNLYYKKIHDLKYLLNVIKKKRTVPEPLFEQADLLSAYAIDSRYPDHWNDPSLEETKECIKAAQNFKKYIFNEIEEQI